MRFEVLISVPLGIMVFCYVKLYHWVSCSDILNIMMSSSSHITQSTKTELGQLKVKINTLQSFEMLQISDPITQHHIQEGIIPSYL